MNIHLKWEGFRPTPEQHFPDDLKVNLILQILDKSNHSIILSLKNAIWIERPSHSHFQCFFQPIHPLPYDKYFYTTLSHYVDYLKGLPQETHTVYWLNPDDLNDAYVGWSHIKLESIGLEKIKLFYDSSLNPTVVWLAEGTDLRNLKFLAIQQTMDRLWQRQHYYTHVLKGQKV